MTIRWVYRMPEKAVRVLHATRTGPSYTRRVQTICGFLLECVRGSSYMHRGLRNPDILDGRLCKQCAAKADYVAVLDVLERAS